MFINQDKSKSHGILRLIEGTELAVGSVSVDYDMKSVTFKSDFVPLYNIGTPVEMVRVHDGREVHRFVGGVYISDKTMMKILPTDDEVLPGAEYYYCVGKSYPLTLSSPEIQSEMPQKRKWFGKSKKDDQAIEIVAEIVELTPKMLVFKYDVNTVISSGQTIKVCADAALPLPESFELSIKKAVSFGPNACYICEILGLSNEQTDKLSSFLLKQATETFKLL